MKEKIYKYSFIISFVILIVVICMNIKVKESVQFEKNKNENHFSQSCLEEQLGALIADVENDIHYIDVREITNNPVEGWTIVKNKVGAYAIIKTEDEQAIKDIKHYFKNLNEKYRYENIKDSWHIFISNALDYDFNELNECIK